MIGIDTNVLLRLLLDDDPAQSSRIDALLDEHAHGAGTVLIADVVLAETTWTLASVYAQPKSALVKAIRALLDEPAYAFENRAAVEQALAAFTAGRFGFSDALIAAKCSALGCGFTATFDRKMRDLPGVKLV